MKKLLFLGALLVGLSSCTMYRTLNLNTDGSGTMENKIDMTEMMALLGEDESMGLGDMSSFMKDGDLDKINDRLMSIDGITNVQTEFDTNGIITTKYDFKNMEALTNSMTSTSTTSMLFGSDGLDEDSKKPMTKITFKGKKFFWQEIDKKGLKKLQSDKVKNDLKEAEMVLASSNMVTTINFPRLVKKVSYDDATIINEGKTVTYTRKMTDFLSPKYKPLVVKLK